MFEGAFEDVQMVFFIISCQIFLVQIKLNAFFEEEKNLLKLDITYHNNRIKSFYIVEYLGCHVDVNLSGESMTMKSLNKTNANKCIPFCLKIN